MKFYLSLTDADGVLLDRFPLELPRNERPDGDIVAEDSETVGRPYTNLSLCERLATQMRRALTRSVESTPAPAPATPPARRFSRREIVATALGTDIADVSAYQPGRYTVPVYTDGVHYYCATKPGDSAALLAKDLGPWTMLSDADYLRGWIVWKAIGEVD